MNVVAYMRVSSDRQADEGYGLDVQRADIEKWAAEGGHTIVGWEQDEETGKNGLEHREGLARAVQMVEEGAAPTLVVHRYDRLARKLYVQMTVINRVAELGGTVVSVKEPDVDGPDELRELIRNILGAIAEFDRARIVTRLRAGAERKAAAGSRYAWGGRPPYGWRAERKELVPDEDEQAVLRWIHELHEDGLSSRKIAEQLNHEGFTRRAGGAWHHENVRRALMHPPVSEGSEQNAS